MKKKKTFTAWVNKHLQISGITITNLFDQFADGVTLVIILFY